MIDLEGLNDLERSLRTSSQAVLTIRRIARALVSMAKEDPSMRPKLQSHHWRMLITAFGLDSNDPELVPKLEAIAKGIDE